MTLRAFATATLISVTAVTASQAAIIGATDAIINSGGPGFGNIADTFNQNGLSNTYITSVTDFTSFVTTTTHDLGFAGNEWFSNSPSTSASVTYDLGSVNMVDKVALWNEDASGIGSLDLSVSSDGLTYSSLLSGLSPINNSVGFDYGAEIFNFGATDFQFMRFDMSGCPQAGATFDACAIGEVAFNKVSVVPLPAGLPLLLTGLGLFGFLRHRKTIAT